MSPQHPARGMTAAEIVALARKAANSFFACGYNRVLLGGGLYRPESYGLLVYPNGDLRVPTANAGFRDYDPDRVFTLLLRAEHVASGPALARALLASVVTTKEVIAGVWSARLGDRDTGGYDSQAQAVDALLDALLATPEGQDVSERLALRVALDLIADPAAWLTVRPTLRGFELAVYPVRVLAGVPWKEGAQGHGVGAAVVRSLLRDANATYDLA